MLKIIPLICGLIGLLFAFLFHSWVRNVGKGTSGNENIVQYSQEESGVFYRKDWVTIIIVVIVLSVVVGICLGWASCALYAYGALISILIELVGAHILNTSKTKFENFIGSDADLFRIGIRSGYGVGLFITSFGLLALGAIFVPFSFATAIKTISSFGFGVATIALFNETKYIMAADLYSSYMGTLVATIMLANYAVDTSHITSTFTASIAAVYPLLIAGTGALACILGTAFIRRKDRGNINVRINVGTYVSAIVLIAASVFLSINLLQSYLYTVVLALGVICGIITGISSVKRTSLVAVIAFAASFILSYKFIGVYGLALSAIGFTAITSALIATSSYGLVTETESSIVRTADGYATCSSALSVLALYVAYINLAGLEMINISSPKVLVGLFVGIMMPMVYASIFARSEDFDNNYEFIMRLTSFILPGIVGIVFGAESLGAFLGGLIAAGMVTSLVFNNIGVKQDDSDGNNFSICASVNSMIKFMTLFSLVFTPVFIKFGGLLS